MRTDESRAAGDENTTSLDVYLHCPLPPCALRSARALPTLDVGTLLDDVDAVVAVEVRCGKVARYRAPRPNSTTLAV
jgi:hypothetical protein